MLTKEFDAAINQICDEKDIDREVVIKTIEAALAAAYRKDYGKPDQNIKTKFNPKTGNFDIFDVKEVVAKEEEITDSRKQILFSEAKKKKKSVKVGEEIKAKIKPPGDYGRVAAQTAKQVIVQRIREAERNALFQTFKKREGELVTGVIQRIEGNTIFVDLGQATGFIPISEQVSSENYRINQRLKVYISEVREGSKGPEVVLSRTHPEMIKILFSLEVPEVNAGTVEIKTVAREPGLRSKVAVKSSDPEVDPIGACVGQRGSRVQAVINEIDGEKIDIIEWAKDPVKFISNALAPAKVVNVEVGKTDNTARVLVEPDQLSLAIGKEGQNVRLAAKLTAWKIDVKPVPVEEEEKVEAKKVKEEKETRKETAQKVKSQKSKIKNASPTGRQANKKLKIKKIEKKIVKKEKKKNKKVKKGPSKEKKEQQENKK